MGVMTEFGGGTQTLEQLDGDLAVLELLHVDAHEPAHVDGLLVEGGQPPVDAFNGILQRNGVRPRIKGRRLDGDVHLGHGAPVHPAVRPVPGQGGPFPLLFRQRVQHLMVAGGVGVAFLLIDRGFAEQIDGEGEAVLAQLGQPTHRLLDVLPDDELAAHALDVGADGSAHDLGGQRAAEPGLPRAPAQDGGHFGAAGGEILADVPKQGFRGVQVGQHVHEAEQLHLEVLVFHGPVHDFPGPPALVEDGGGLSADAVEKFLPTRHDFLFDLLIHKALLSH